MAGLDREGVLHQPPTRGVDVRRVYDDRRDDLRVEARQLPSPPHHHSCCRFASHRRPGSHPGWRHLHTCSSQPSVAAVLAGCLGSATTDSPELFKRMAITLASGQDGNGKAAEFVRERIDKKTAEVDKAIQVLQEVGQTTHRLNLNAQ